MHAWLDREAPCADPHDEAHDADVSPHPPQVRVCAASRDQDAGLATPSMPSRALTEAAEQGLVLRSVRLVLAGVGVSVLDCTRRATGDTALREILYLSATGVRLKHLLG